MKQPKFKIKEIVYFNYDSEFTKPNHDKPRKIIGRIFNRKENQWMYKLQNSMPGDLVYEYQIMR